MTDQFQLHLDTRDLKISSDGYYTLTGLNLSGVKYVEMHSVEIPMSYHNINATNNVLKYTENNVDIKTITLTVGYYSIDALVTELGVRLGVDYAITVKSNTNKLVFTRVSNFSIKYNESTLADIIGLVADTIYGQSATMQNAYNLVGTNYFVISSEELILPSNNKNSLYSVDSGNYICKIPNNIGEVGFGNVMSYAFKLSKKLYYPSRPVISKISFRLLDMYGALVNLNGSNYSMTLNVYL